MQLFPVGVCECVGAKDIICGPDCACANADTNFFSGCALAGSRNKAIDRDGGLFRRLNDIESNTSTYYEEILHY